MKKLIESFKKSQGKDIAMDILGPSQSKDQLRKDVDAFFSIVIHEGQSIARLIEDTRKRANDDYGVKITDRELIEALSQYIAKKSPWGSDAMTKFWAKALVTGEGLF